MNNSLASIFFWPTATLMYRKLNQGGIVNDYLWGTGQTTLLFDGEGTCGGQNEQYHFIVINYFIIIF
jgi:hypothetical protein